MKPTFPTEPPAMNAEELFAIYGTPEYHQELDRQAKMIAEYDRRLRPEDRWDVDWAWLENMPD